MNSEQQKIIIIGGGPAGMMAAIRAAQAGRSVVVLEHMNRCGRKILATGNGRCNFTNRILGEDCYNSNGGFAMSVIRQFDNQQLLRYFEELGVLSREKNGFLYPYSEQASSILQVLERHMRQLGVVVKTGTEVSRIQAADNGYQVFTNDGTFYAGKVIVAAGSKASPKSGSDGSGYKLLADMGISIKKPLPALTSLHGADPVFKNLAGIRCEAAVAILHKDKTVAKERGELQLTDYGISGIPVFQVSSIAVRLIHQYGRIRCEIDFVPFMSINELVDYTKERCKRSPNDQLYDIFTGTLNSKLTDTMMTFFGFKKNTMLGDLSDARIEQLAHDYKHFCFELNGYHSYDFAQVCQGGVLVDEIDDRTMESRRYKGLYFAGEIVDVDGKCGGYNLQWAFSSGYVAGGAASQ